MIVHFGDVSWILGNAAIPTFSSLSRNNVGLRVAMAHSIHVLAAPLAQYSMQFWMKHEKNCILNAFIEVLAYVSLKICCCISSSLNSWKNSNYFTFSFRIQHLWWLQIKNHSTFLIPVDSTISPNFNMVGVIMISTALLFDAIIGNVQEKAMREYKANNVEVVLYSYGIGFIYLLVILALRGSLLSSLRFCATVSQITDL